MWQRPRRPATGKLSTNRTLRTQSELPVTKWSQDGELLMVSWWLSRVGMKCQFIKCNWDNKCNDTCWTYESFRGRENQSACQATTLLPEIRARWSWVYRS